MNLSKTIFYSIFLTKCLLFIFPLLPLQRINFVWTCFNYFLNLYAPLPVLTNYFFIILDTNATKLTFYFMLGCFFCSFVITKKFIVLKENFLLINFLFLFLEFFESSNVLKRGFILFFLTSSFFAYSSLLACKVQLYSFCIYFTLSYVLNLEFISPETMIPLFIFYSFFENPSLLVKDSIAFNLFYNQGIFLSLTYLNFFSEANNLFFLSVYLLFQFFPKGFSKVKGFSFLGFCCLLSLDLFPLQPIKIQLLPAILLFNSLAQTDYLSKYLPSNEGHLLQIASGYIFLS